MNLAKINKINIYCYALYCLYAIFSLTILGYGVFFLEKLGFSYMEIGLTIGISALVSSLIQPMIGRYADMKQYSWKNILIILTLIMLISSMGIFVAPKSIVIYLFSIMIIVLGCLYPFMNTGVFYYEDHGVDTNFGVSRGFASLSYMIFSAITGVILINHDFMVINVFSVAAAILMLIVLFFLPYYGSNVKVEHTSKSLKNNVLIKYPIFTLIFIAMTLFMMFHNTFLCYMINIFENLGGNITDVSAANSLGALLELPVMFLFYKLLERISAKKLILIASFFYVARSIMIYAAQDTLTIYLSFILHMLTFAIVIPASVHFANEVLDEADTYEGQAFMGSTITIGLIFANLIGGNILHVYDIHLLLVVLVVMTVLGCLFAVASMIVDR